MITTLWNCRFPIEKSIKLKPLYGSSRNNNLVSLASFFAVITIIFVKIKRNRLTFSLWFPRLKCPAYKFICFGWIELKGHWKWFQLRRIVASLAWLAWCHSLHQIQWSTRKCLAQDLVTTWCRQLYSGLGAFHDEYVFQVLQVRSIPLVYPCTSQVAIWTSFFESSCFKSFGYSLPIAAKQHWSPVPHWEVSRWMGQFWFPINPK